MDARTCQCSPCPSRPMTLRPCSVPTRVFLRRSLTASLPFQVRCGRRLTPHVREDSTRRTQPVRTRAPWAARGPGSRAERGCGGGAGEAVSGAGYLEGWGDGRLLAGLIWFVSLDVGLPGWPASPCPSPPPATAMWPTPAIRGSKVHNHVSGRFPEICAWWACGHSAMV